MKNFLLLFSVIKIITIVCVIVFICGCSSTQNVVLPVNEKQEVLNNEVNIFNSSSDTVNIKGEQFIFPDVVWRIFYDYDNKALIITKKANDNPLIKPTTLIYYDLINKKVVWAKKSLSNNFTILDNNIIVLQGKRRIFGIDKQTGDIIWRREGVFDKYDPKNKIGFYGLRSAFDLNTGANLWQRQIKGKHGLTEEVTKDSIMYAVGDGIYSYNIRTGKGWEISMPTSKTDVLKQVGEDIGLGVLGAFTGTYYSGVQADYYTCLTSNLLFLGNRIYFSALNNFVCLDLKTGKEIWRAELPDKKTAAAKLIVDADNIVITNLGYRYKHSVKNKHGFRTWRTEQQKFGNPYIAKYNSLTGEKLFYTPIETDSPLIDLNKNVDGYYIINSNTLYHYDLSGNLQGKATKDTISEGGFKKLIKTSKSGTLTKDGNNFIPIDLAHTDTTGIDIYTKNQIFSYDNFMNVKNENLYSTIYYPCFKDKDFSLIKSIDRRNYNYYLVNYKKAILGELNAGNPVNKMKDIYCYTNKNGIITFNLPKH